MRTPAQKRYAEKNRQKLAQKNKEYKSRPEVKAARVRQASKRRNKLNSDLGWRWLSWSSRFKKNLTIDYKELQIRMVNERDLHNPSFTFEIQGRKVREYLRDPLPTW